MVVWLHSLVFLEHVHIKFISVIKEEVIKKLGKMTYHDVIIILKYISVRQKVTGYLLRAYQRALCIKISTM